MIKKIKKMVKTVFAVWMLFALFSSLPVAEAAGENIASGVIDEDYGQITWVIDSEGTLTVTGTGDIRDPEESYTDQNTGIPWKDYRYEIKSAQISVMGMKNASYLFYGYDSLSKLDLSNFDTSNITDMSYMFCVCGSLSELDLSSFDTSNVTDMSFMFYWCSSLSGLDLSSFDTSRVTNMSHMFYGCKSLNELDVSSFNTSNVTDMSTMVRGCRNLKELDLSSFDTSNVTDMSFMFYLCSSLSGLDVSNFNTSRVTNMADMFFGCSSLNELDLSSFDTSRVTNMGGMFYECRSLSKLDVSSFNTSNVTNMSGMFDGCRNLSELDVSSFDTTNVTKMSGMFEACSSLSELDVSNFNTTNVTDMSDMFASCSGLSELDVSNFNTTNVSTMDYMFSGTSGLKELDISNFDTSNVTNMNYMFSGANELKELDISNFDTSNVTTMSGMFYLCSGLSELDVSSFDTSNVTDMSHMFYLCSGLSELDVSSFDTSNVKNMVDIFQWCKKLKVLDLSGFDFKSIDISDYRDMLLECSNLEYIKTPINIPEVIINLPISSDKDVWYLADGSEVTHLLTGISYSVSVGKNYIPGEQPETTILKKDGVFHYDGTGDGIASYTYHYDESWFSESSYVYQHDLTRMSMRAAVAAYDVRNIYGDGNGDKFIKELMEDLGFTYWKKSKYDIPESDSIGYAISSKDIISTDGEKTSLIFVAVRGGGYEKEWMSNATVGRTVKDGGDLVLHEGFGMAADQVLEGINTFVQERKDVLQPNIKIWIVGYSRAGAATNIVAKRLIDGEYYTVDKKYKNGIEGLTPNNVYAFCFECPQNTVEDDCASTKYDNIINIINPIDIVTEVAMDEWSFSRYGSKFHIPALSTTKEYLSLKNKMIDEYKEIVRYKDDSSWDYNYVYESPGQASLINGLTADLAHSVGDTRKYVNNYQTPIRNLISWKMFGGEWNLTLTDSVNLGILYNKFVLRFESDTNVEGLFLDFSRGLSAWETLKIYNLTKIFNAHYPELCIAWLDSLEGLREEDYLKYRKVCLDTSMNVSVYDSMGNIVAKVGDVTVADEVINTISVYKDYNGQIVFELPGDEEYQIVMSAEEDCNTYCVLSEYNMSTSANERIIAYTNIPLKKGEQLTLNADKCEEGLETDYELQTDTGEIIEVTVDQSGDECQSYYLDVEVKGSGNVIGGGVYLHGETAILKALPSENSRFIGWFIENEMVSSELEYKAQIDDDLKITAVFTEVQTKNKVTDIFTDVYDDWYTDYVQYVYDNNMMTGISGTTLFQPNNNITKAQVAQVLYNMEGKPNITDKKVFKELKDIYEGEWFANAVAWAYNTGVVTGDKNTKRFNPNADVTREQLALMMYRYAAYKKYDTSHTSNFAGLQNADKVSSWALEGVRWAVGSGMISGIQTGGVKDLAPQGNATRAQTAAILQRFCEQTN